MSAGPCFCLTIRRWAQGPSSTVHGALWVSGYYPRSPGLIPPLNTKIFRGPCGVGTESSSEPSCSFVLRGPSSRATDKPKAIMLPTSRRSFKSPEHTQTQFCHACCKDKESKHIVINFRPLGPAWKGSLHTVRRLSQIPGGSTRRTRHHPGTNI